MEKLNQSVQDFMDNQLLYDNPHNVEITTNEFDSVCVASDWPGEQKSEATNLELFFESETIAEFILIFGITSVNDLPLITPAFLLTLYQQGKADICCSVGTLIGYFPMRYRKQHNGMQATDDGGIKHDVLVLLETPQQFIDYTHGRSQLSKSPPFS